MVGTVLVLGTSPVPAAAVDPVGAPPDLPSVAQPPSDGLLFSGPRTEAVGGGGSVMAVTQPNFQEQVVWPAETFTFPIAIEFAADGRVFVAEKGGLIKVRDNLNDQTSTNYADLTSNVHSYWDRGLLGMTLDPDFLTNGRMYVSYAYGVPLGAGQPTWDDMCPTPPGGTTDGCVVSGRVSVLTDGASEQVLINDWCQQFPSHSMSDIVIDAEGALIVGGGDGASFDFFDYGQAGGSLDSPTVRNPCGDPPGGVGGPMAPPSAEGGGLRSQDIRTTGDPLGLDGAIIRINRFTGAPMPDNPRTTGPVNEQRIVAFGLRNPFRMAIHPTSGELWFGDVGWNTWEEINHFDPDGSVVRNFGWPCREGFNVQASYQDLALCQSLTSGWTNPHYVYRHDQATVPGDGCVISGSSISAMAFYAGGIYPDEYDNALFFGDYSRRCIWVMMAGPDGTPNAGDVRLFIRDAQFPANMTAGPGGDIYYLSAGGSVRRIAYVGAGNSAPTARIGATPSAGPLPLAASFSASASTDPDNDSLSYAWDFGDDDGQFDDAFGVSASHTYTTSHSYQARVRVDDGHGGVDIAAIQIDAGNRPPQATITAPASSLRWSVGQQIGFSGAAADADGTLPDSAFTWDLTIAHCDTPSTCHQHPIETFTGVRSGVFNAPDHEYPSHLVLRLTVDDGGGASDTTEMDVLPRTVTLQIRSSPNPMTITAGSQTRATPFSLTAIAGSAIQLNAPTGQLFDGFPHEWSSWSQGGPKAQIVRPMSSMTYTATFSGGYTDVPPGTKFRADIAWLTREGIAAGCSPTRFCPNGEVTRGQMATFLVRALGLPSTATDFFTDDETNKHEANINRLAAAGITAGCSPTRFCPDGVVTRAQMATFLVRAFGLPATSTDFFTDDETNKHEANINRLAASGITSGCGGTAFCPDGAVTRRQMAAFLHRAMPD